MSVRPQTKDKPAAASFQWDDPFLLDELLTEDERMIRDTARAYAQDKLLPRVINAYLEEKTDRDIFNEMGELGLIGVTLPEEYGCAKAPATSPMAWSRARSSGSIPAIDR